MRVWECFLKHLRKTVKTKNYNYSLFPSRKKVLTPKVKISTKLQKDNISASENIVLTSIFDIIEYIMTQAIRSKPFGRINPEKVPKWICKKKQKTKKTKLN